MRLILWFNGVVCIVSTLFALGAGLLHWIYIPKSDYFQLPPNQVEMTLKQTSDAVLLREIGLTLFEHVGMQTVKFNQIVDLMNSGMFWNFVLFSVFGLFALMNFVLIKRKCSDKL